MKFAAGLTALMLAGLLASTSTAGAVGPYAAEGGQLSLDLQPGALNRLGVRSSLPKANKGWAFSTGAGGTLDFQLSDGDAVRLTGGSLRLVGGPKFSWPGGTVDLSHFRLEPADDDTNTLVIVDASGRSWFSLHMGHFDFRPEHAVLAGQVMDVRLAPEFASALGVPRLAGQYLGSAKLEVRLAGIPEAKGSSCTVPTWPTDEAAVADLEMIDIPNIDQLFDAAASEAGRVVITPSATFRNAGTADLPWFSVFTTPELDEDFCQPAENGGCEPYGNDQQGLLVWSVYRLSFGRLEQLGRSGVKHAFNSVNFNCPCDFGRIVWTGCEDLYGASTNADHRFLGGRDRVEAHPVLFDRCGSVFDEDCDDVCDNPTPPDNLWKCEANQPADSLARRLTVAEADLSTANARYFIETWYLVRDDVDILNSMGFLEFRPMFVETSPGTGVWDFDPVGLFRSGPVLLGLAEDAGLSVELMETPTGLLAVATGTQPDLEGTRYRVNIMNFDFDPRLDQVAVPVHRSADVTGLFFSDGDTDAANDWLTSVGDHVTFSAPGDEALDWGTMFTFEFRSRLEPITGQGLLSVAAPAPDERFIVDLPRPAPTPDYIHGSGFE